MKLVDMVCPNCGAKIQADADMGSAKCEHCALHLYWTMKPFM